ncbi:MAG: amidophosphoribosyltransferase [Anaerolineaceae bacterium]|nr:MAG: amidophosphoribosyltransferase [Anaerolineaceae bacterium]
MQISDEMKPYEDKPREECGVYGVYARGRDVARLTFFGLFALQHRGQEGAGIVTCDGEVAWVHKGMGLVPQIFDEESLRPLRGHIAIGHNRYSTTGGSNFRNTSPYLIESIDGPLGVSHNGNLTNTFALRTMLLKRGVGLSSTTDSEVITQMLAAPPETWLDGDLMDVDGDYLDVWQHRIKAVMQVAEGAYSLTLLTRNGLYGVRDPLGMRPLCLGKLGDQGWVLASESCALTTIGAEFVRDVEPGEIVKIDDDGVHSIIGKQSERRAMCIFEYVYFARPDTHLEGQSVHAVRQQLGRQLAIESHVDADIVIGVPDSAIPGAIGYSQQTGVPFTEGFTKNRYIGRTFIQPDDQLRKDSVKLKLNTLSDNLRGKRVIVVDDSIVRGNTSGPIVSLLRSAGATEVHMRISSPPIKHPCFMGVDMATHKQLIAYNLSVEEIRQRIGADTLQYLSIDGLQKAVMAGLRGKEHGHCNACFSGKYPVAIPQWLFEDEADAPVIGAWGQ